MTAIAGKASALLLIDFQMRLMPAIDGAEGVIANAQRLQAAARLLGVPVLLTEQNPAGLGRTVPELLPPAESAASPIFAKQSFDAGRAAGFFEHLPERPELVLAGCEAHVCVLQTALGLMATGRRVHVVQDAVAIGLIACDAPDWSSPEDGQDPVSSLKDLFEVGRVKEDGETLLGHLVKRRVDFASCAYVHAARRLIQEQQTRRERSRLAK